MAIYILVLLTSIYFVNVHVNAHALLVDKKSIVNWKGLC